LSACSSDKGIMKVKTSEWLEVVAWYRGREILFSELIANCLIWKGYLVASIVKCLILINVNREGYIRSTKQQLGAWEPSQHLLEGGENPRQPVLRWPVAGPAACIMTSGKQYNTKVP
jgi:hypothetical protein